MPCLLRPRSSRRRSGSVSPHYPIGYDFESFGATTWPSSARSGAEDLRVKPADRPTSSEVVGAARALRAVVSDFAVAHRSRRHRRASRRTSSHPARRSTRSASYPNTRAIAPTTTTTSTTSDHGVRRRHLASAVIANRTTTTTARAPMPLVCPSPGSIADVVALPDAGHAVLSVTPPAILRIRDVMNGTAQRRSGTSKQRSASAPKA